MKSRIIFGGLYFSIAACLFMSMLFFYGCRNVKKNVSQSSSESSVQINSEEKGMQLVNIGSEEATELTTFSSNDSEFDFEITGPAIVSFPPSGGTEGGSIQSTSPQTVIKARQKNRSTEETTSRSERSDSIIFKLDTGSNRVVVADTKKEEDNKQVERSIPWYNHLIWIALLLGLGYILYKGITRKKWFL